MAKLLALEWDGREARVAVAKSTGKSFVIDDAFVIELTPRDPGQTFADTSLSDRLVSALSARHIGKVESLVGVGRAGIELRVLSVPNAPDAELPEMVRFQAMRQFTALGDDWPLDFVKLQEEGGEGGLNVLAAAISPELVEQIEETCAGAELAPQRLILRPFAAASLLGTRPAGGKRCQMLVDLLADEADLTVLIDQRVVFIRTVRLVRGSDDILNRALVGEIRRTVVAAQNQLGGQRVEEIIVCGDSEHESLRTKLAEALNVGAELFNPFDRLPCSEELSAAIPSQPGRFAPLLGMLVDELTGTSHQIDFLNPRRKPEPPNRKRMATIVAASVAVVLLGVFGIIWMNLSAMDSEIYDLVEERNSLKESLDKEDHLQRQALAIDRWLLTDVNWLDELRHLSENMPSPDDAIVTYLSATAGTSQQGGGAMLFQGGVSDTPVIGEMTRELSDDRHSIKSYGSEPTDDAGGFETKYKKQITIAPPIATQD